MSDLEKYIKYKFKYLKIKNFVYYKLNEKGPPTTTKKFIDIKSLEKLQLYKIARELPKGVLLHCHLSALVNITKFIFYLKDNYRNLFNNIYFVKDYNKIRVYNDKMSSLLSNDIWLKYKVFNIPFNLDNDCTNGLVYFPNICPDNESYTQLSTLDRMDITNIINAASRMMGVTEYNWISLEHKNDLIWSFIKIEDIFPLYFRFLLDEAISENLIGIEIKT